MVKILFWSLLLAGQFSLPTLACEKIDTPYPRVLIHGLGGFDGSMFDKSYWGDLPQFLKDKGAIVLLAKLSAANDSFVRGEQLYQQLKEWGYEKYHLIGHSQGGKDARFVHSKYRDLVASVTTISSPHHGSPLADVIYNCIEALPPLGSNLIWKAGDVMGCGIDMLSHHYGDIETQSKKIANQLFSLSSTVAGNLSLKCLWDASKNALCRIKPSNIVTTAKNLAPHVSTIICNLAEGVCSGVNEVYDNLLKQNAKQAIKCLTTESSEEFNMRCPLGVGNEKSNAKLYSWGTCDVECGNVWDVVGKLMQLSGYVFFKDERNDGVVSLKSMRFGDWLGELLGTYHFLPAFKGFGSDQEEHVAWVRTMFLTLADKLDDSSL